MGDWRNGIRIALKTQRETIRVQIPYRPGIKSHLHVVILFLLTGRRRRIEKWYLAVFISRKYANIGAQHNAIDSSSLSAPTIGEQDNGSLIVSKTIGLGSAPSSPAICSSSSVGRAPDFWEVSLVAKQVAVNLRRQVQFLYFPPNLGVVGPIPAWNTSMLFPEQPRGWISRSPPDTERAERL